VAHESFLAALVEDEEDAKKSRVLGERRRRQQAKKRQKEGGSTAGKHAAQVLAQGGGGGQGGAEGEDTARQKKKNSVTKLGRAMRAFDFGSYDFHPNGHMVSGRGAQWAFDAVAFFGSDLQWLGPPQSTSGTSNSGRDEGRERQRHRHAEKMLTDHQVFLTALYPEHISRFYAASSTVSPSCVAVGRSLMARFGMRFDDQPQIDPPGGYIPSFQTGVNHATDLLARYEALAEAVSTGRPPPRGTSSPAAAGQEDGSSGGSAAE
jgi:hypothetical protein